MKGKWRRGDAEAASNRVARYGNQGSRAAAMAW